MADVKYRKGAVPITEEQMAIIEKAMEKFHEQYGVKLTRSQALAMLAHWYVKN